MEFFEVGLASQKRGRCRGGRECVARFLVRCPGRRVNEAISSPVHRLNALRILRIVVESLPQGQYARLENGFLYENVWPHCLQQLFLGDDPRWILGEISEYGEGFRLQRNPLAFKPDALVCRI